LPTIYKQELAHRLPNVRLERHLDVTFDSFQKRYFVDVLVGDGGLFEFKAAESLAEERSIRMDPFLFFCPPFFAF
jgi:hypothetical protein